MHLSGGTLIMHEKLISQQRKDVFERMNKNYEK